MAEKLTQKKKFLLSIPLYIATIIIAVVLPRKGFGLEYAQGSVWRHENLTAACDFPLLKSQEEINEEEREIASQNIPYFTYSYSAEEKAISRILNADLGKFEQEKAHILDVVRAVYKDYQGIIPESFDTSRVKLIYIEKAKQTAKFPIEEVLTYSDAVRSVTNSLKAAIDDCDTLVANLKNTGFIVSNLVYDEATSQKMLQNALKNISKTKGLIPSGTLIVKKGDIVTKETASYLDSYKYEYNTRHIGHDTPTYLMWIGNTLMAIILVLTLAFFIAAFDGKTFTRHNRYYYLVVIFTLTVVAITSASQFFGKYFLSKQYFFAVPFTVFALYLFAFFKKSIILPSYLLALTPMLLIDEYGTQAYIINMFAGCVGIYSYQRFNRGYQQFVTSLLIFLAMTITYSTFVLIGGTHYDVNMLVSFAVSSLASVLLVPVVYIFEKIFNLISSSRLKDLCEANNPLLRELSTNAAGTYHHSEQVANIAAAAAESIGADVDLVRAGAMYHDIGKLYEPSCFVENQAHGDDYFHAGLSPTDSANAIIRHVQEGVERAKEHNLPKVIVDMIRTHHGTTTTNYFYTKYLNDGGSEDNRHLFVYPGPNPKTKEQVILMICDTLEAASRTLTDYKPATIDNLVSNIFTQKMNEGQFDEAEISLEELQILKNFLPKYLSDAYHGRIVYPKRKKMNNKK